MHTVCAVFRGNAPLQLSRQVRHEAQEYVQYIIYNELFIIAEERAEVCSFSEVVVQIGGGSGGGGPVRLVVVGGT